MAWMLTPAVANQLTRTETGYAGATGLLALLLWTLYRQGSRPLGRDAAQSAPTARAIAR
jgi:hypothetical protein